MLQSMYSYLPNRIEGGAIPLLLTPLLILMRLAALLASAIFYRLDVRWKITNAGFPKNYVVVAHN